MSNFNDTLNDYVVSAARRAARDFLRPFGKKEYTDYYYVFTQDELNLFLQFFEKMGGKRSNVIITNVYGDYSDEFYCYQVGVKQEV